MYQYRSVRHRTITNEERDFRLKKIIGLVIGTLIRSCVPYMYIKEKIFIEQILMCE